MALRESTESRTSEQNLTQQMSLAGFISGNLDPEHVDRISRGVTVFKSVGMAMQCAPVPLLSRTGGPVLPALFQVVPVSFPHVQTHSRTSGVHGGRWNAAGPSLRCYHLDLDGWWTAARSPSQSLHSLHGLHLHFKIRVDTNVFGPGAFKKRT